jgi:YHS domain-containing protein
MKAMFIYLKAARAAAVLFSTVVAFGGQVDTVNTDGKGIALKGYDVVAYFQQSRPVKGSSQFSYQWMDATWQFSSAQNRDLFAADPQRYAPQYGGYCAYAVSHGHTASVNPIAWRIVDGKLYLNHDKLVHRLWGRDAPGHIQKADKNWPDLHK